MRSVVCGRCVRLALAVAVVPVLVVAAGVGAAEIPPGPGTSLPDFFGGPARPNPTASSGVPQNPYLESNPFNSIHFDSWNSDVADLGGPLGHDPTVLSSTFAEARQHSGADDAPAWIFDCPTLFFDSRGRPITVCFSPSEATVVLADPDTLEVLSFYALEVPAGDPYRGLGRQQLFVSMGSSYSFVDGEDRISLASGGKKIVTLVEGGSEQSPVLELREGGTYDLSAVLPADDHITGIMTDWHGRIWVTTAGTNVFVVNPATFQPADPQSVKHCTLGSNEVIQNTFAVTETGAYIVTSAKLYRVRADADDQPYVVWAEPYDTTTGTTDGWYVNGVKNGQYELGSGTSPTILGDGEYVAITDNAQPIKVVVFRTDESVGPGERKVCEVPVFEDQEGGADSNSLIGFRHSLVAANTYGYWFDWQSGRLLSASAPGIERIDVDPEGDGCRKVWVNGEVATTVSPRLSTRTGLIFTIARRTDDAGVDAYYWTAVDFRTGETVWQKMAGTGAGFDSFYPPLGIGPNGGLYSGAYGGFLAIREASRRWIPSVTRGKGLEGSVWRSDVAVLNPGSGTASAQTLLHLQGSVATRTVTVPAGNQLVLTDVVGSFGLAGSGALEVVSDQPVVVSSRTYHQEESGTVGQEVASFPAGAGLSAGESAWLPQLSENVSSRTNIALTNTGAVAANVTVELFDGWGTSLASYGVTLEPGQYAQQTRPFATEAGRSDLTGGYAKVTVVSGEGVIALASVVDNVTNDPTTVVMVRQ